MVLPVAAVLAALTLGVASLAWAASKPSVSVGLQRLPPGSVRLTATVNPEGSEVTDCHFEYARVGRFFPTVGEASVPCSELPGAGSSPVKVSAVVSGLQNGFEYWFRTVATNAVGTSVTGYLTMREENLEVVRVTPSKGRTGGGKRVKVFGFGFEASPVVHFGAATARAELKCGISGLAVRFAGCVIIAISPPEAAGTVDVTVTTNGAHGLETSAVTPNDHFTYK
jgi:hypothetical protein